MDIDIEAAAILLLAIIVGINILGVKIKKVQIPIVIFSAAYLFALCVYAIAYHDLDYAVSSKDSLGVGRMLPLHRHLCLSPTLV